MKTLAFDKASWHYRLASLYAGYKSYDGRDICTYTKYVMGGLGAILLGLTAFGLISLLLLNAVIGAIFSLMHGVNLLDEMAAITLILSGAGCFVAGFVWTIVTYSNYQARRRAERLWGEPATARPDNFVRKAYKSWKEKFCLQIEFIETEKD